ncbi:MAG: hypothetical protein Q7S79_03985 [bacterium]|nr:hypothetical protein [bacterium]
MKILVLHGDNQVASRQRLNEVISESKKKGINIINVNGATVKKPELLTLARSQDLLGATELLVIENFFANKKAPEILKDLVENQEQVSNSCLFWEGKAVPASKIPKKPFIKVEAFQIPQSIFRVLDLITPGTKQQALKLVQEKGVRDNAEFFFVMLVRQIRNLLWIKLDAQTMSSPAWQKGKLKSQAGKFSENDLRALQSKLLEIDYQSKTSKLPENLAASLDMLVASL